MDRFCSTLAGTEWPHTQFALPSFFFANRKNHLRCRKLVYGVLSGIEAR